MRTEVVPSGEVPEPADAVAARAMRSMRSQVTAAVLWAAFLIVMTVVALGFGPEARRAPLLVGSAGSALGVALVVRVVRQAGRDPARTAIGWRHLETTVGPVLWISVFVAAFVAFGSLGPAVIATPMFLRLHGGEPIRVILPTTAALGALTWVVVTLVLRSELYPGWIPAGLLGAPGPS